MLIWKHVTCPGVRKGGESIRQRMARGEQLVAARGFSYSARVPASRPATDYTHGWCRFILPLKFRWKRCVSFGSGEAKSRER
jgi:hypothetical protein